MIRIHKQDLYFATATDNHIVCDYVSNRIF